MSNIYRPWHYVADREIKRLVACRKCMAPKGSGCTPEGGNGKTRTSGGKLKRRNAGMHYARYEDAYELRYGQKPNVPTWNNAPVSNREMFNNYTEPTHEEKAHAARERAGMRAV